MASKIWTVKAIRHIFSVLWLLLYYTCLLFYFLKGTITFVFAWTLFSTCIPPHVIKQPPNTLHKPVYSIGVLHIESCQNWKNWKPAFVWAVFCILRVNLMPCQEWGISKSQPWKKESLLCSTSKKTFSITTPQIVHESCPISLFKALNMLGWKLEYFKKHQQ